MKRVKAGAALALWCVALAAGLTFLHRLRPSEPNVADGSAYVITAVRHLALAMGWYLAGATAVSVSAHVSRSRHLLRLSALVTLGPIQRLARSAAGVAVAVSTFAPTAAVAQNGAPPPVMTWVQEDGASPVAAPPPDPAPPSGPQSAVADREVVVAPGDHLWALASRRMAENLGREPSDKELTPYWIRVVEANVTGGHLRDAGAPDLIYPGDRVVLPAP